MEMEVTHIPPVRSDCRYLPALNHRRGVAVISLAHAIGRLAAGHTGAGAIYADEGCTVPGDRGLREEHDISTLEAPAPQQAMRNVGHVVQQEAGKGSQKGPRTPLRRDSGYRGHSA